MFVDMPFASTVIVATPLTRILWPLAIKRIVGSPDWKLMPLLLAAIVFMMVLCYELTDPKSLTHTS